MNLDTITLKFQSVVGKMKSDLSEMISKYEKLDNVIENVFNKMDKIANSNNKIGTSFKDSKRNIEDVEKELKSLSETYKLHSKAFDERANKNLDYALPYIKGSDWITDNTSTERITQESLDKEKAKIDEVRSEYQQLKAVIQEPVNKPELIPKETAPKMEEVSKNVAKVGKKADESSKKISRLASIMKSLGSVSKYVGSKGFDFLKNKSNDFTKVFAKGVDGSLGKIKKLALGLIGVRTAMSVLTKAVTAYLSFDSELQDSLNNSWNMLGSLLAPAIELVARLFATATNYIAQFVSALSGIDLVARANAKALETQAKANQKANQAQRGLLSMDEITNLPTESVTSPASQIQIDDTIKSFKLLDDLLSHLKKGQWHLVGEDIAKGINDLLGKINWKDLKEKAYNVGYNFADFLNGLFEVNWSQIGYTIAQSFNTFIRLIKGFVEKFSFIQLGKGIANMISNWFLNIDWDELADTINKGIQGIGDGISTFLETFKWGEIGEKFGKFVASIDWGNILYQAIKISILATVGISEFLGNFFNEIFTGIGYAIGDWIYDSFVDLRKSLEDLGVWLEEIGLSFGDIIIGFVENTINHIVDVLNAFLIPFRAVIVAYGKATGKDWNLKNIKLPYVSLNVGTPNIETEGLYHLHEGEMVVPKRYNPNTDGYDSGADNRQIIDLLISLNSSMLEYADRPIEINMNGRKVAEATYDSLQQIDKNRNNSTAVVRS